MSKPSKTYRLGTRGSLLAVTQSKLVIKELERLTGDHFEMVTIKTEGDANTSAPLWQLNGKDFFTKELDEALLKSEIDLVVHSYKDLGSVRPDGIKLAAVTKRYFPHDILLIKKSTLSKIKGRKELIVGTSSPRRIVNLENYLKDYIPNLDSTSTVATKVLRGNINTRVKKLQNDEYDCIVLAMAGLDRLTTDEKSLAELTELIEGLTFMILPQSIFPSAASQGALAIECKETRSDNGELQNKIKLLQDEDTVATVSRERKSFNEYGGGCHLAMGIHVRKFNNYFHHIHKGKVDHGWVEKNYLEPEVKTNRGNSLVFMGVPSKNLPAHFYQDELIQKITLSPQYEAKHLWITSQNCLAAVKNNEGQILWAAGDKTMKELVKKGHWVVGSTDGLGESELQKYLNSSLIKLFLKKMNITSEILVLTNDQSEHTIGKSLACYTRTVQKPRPELAQKIAQTNIFFWASAFQFKAYSSLFPELLKSDKVHCSGLGKTFTELSQLGIKVVPFPTKEAFIKALN